MIPIDDTEVSLVQLWAVARAGAQVGLSDDPTWQQKLQRSRTRLERALCAGETVYGVSTGVGSRSSQAVDPGAQHAFARAIVAHHGCGLGAPLVEEEARAVVFCRLVSLAKGYSAVRPELLRALCELLNRGVLPRIPRLGSVGASGDLTPLSYLAALLMGEREALFRGETLPAAEALARASLKPLALLPKESLALMNGTSVMTALGALTAGRLERALGWAERVSALAGEVLGCRAGAFHPAAHAVKPHPGQQESARAIFAALQGSGLTDPPPSAERMVQDPYSVRCAPQVLGAARDSLGWAAEVLQRELNSVNDNPLVDPESGAILFAGNFYGGHVALAMDLLKVAAATVTDLLDRQFALLLDSRYNLGLPETLVAYGGNGVKGLQITTTALNALAAQRTNPDSVQSRSTEVGNQDRVSMGQNAALNAAEVVGLLQQVLATLLVALSNAAALRDEGRLSPAGRALLAEVRRRSPVLNEDRRLDRDLEHLVALLDDPRSELPGTGRGR